MKKPSLKYVGDQSVRTLLGALRVSDSVSCRAHAVSLATSRRPSSDASPVQTIKSLWGGELPEFADMVAVNELFEALMSLWNALAKHQSSTKPYRLARMAATPDPDDLRRLCRTRTEELESFVDGLFGDEEVIDLPERANEALAKLGEINAMLHGILDLIERESAPPASEQELVNMFRQVRELSTHRGEGASRTGTVLQTRAPTGSLDHRGGQADDPLTCSPPSGRRVRADDRRFPLTRAVDPVSAIKNLIRDFPGQPGWHCQLQLPDGRVDGCPVTYPAIVAIGFPARSSATRYGSIIVRRSKL